MCPRFPNFPPNHIASEKVTELEVLPCLWRTVNMGCEHQLWGWGDDGSVVRALGACAEVSVLFPEPTRGSHPPVTPVTVSNARRH